MPSRRNLSILIPSIGELSSYELFDAIASCINSNSRLRDRVETILFVSGEPYIPNKYDSLPANTRIISDPDRCGASKARNRLALASSGDFILFCDADSYISSNDTFSSQLLNVLATISASRRDCCYIFSDSKTKTLSPFSFRMTEWNFIVRRELFISSNMFPDKIGVGSCSLAQSGEAQCLFNAMFKSDIVFLPLPSLFGHPTLGTSSEAAELLLENKLYRYNFGASYTTFLMFAQSFSSLSSYHLFSHFASSVILILKLPFKFRIISIMLCGRIHGFLSSILFILKGNSIKHLYRSQ